MKYWTKVLIDAIRQQWPPHPCGCPLHDRGQPETAATAVEALATPNIPPEWTELWENLRAFPIDKPGVQDPLSKRLARERKWTHNYALRVIEEYRKFMFLCVAAGHMCTPSTHVDEAWHLHLLYTKSYWDKLCKEVLGRPIHHHPSDGGTEEGTKFAGMYERTLDSYTTFFGQPPKDIWGTRRK